MKNKKIISIFIAVLISAILLFTQSKSAIRHYSHGQDIQISNLFQHLQYSPELGSQQLLAKQKYSLTFLAQYNNLGTVEFLFSNNNLKQNTNDTIWFRIKEIGSKNWQYQEQYSTSQFNPEKYFSFGFPVIPDSQNTEYLIEIESISGTSQNSISLNQNERQYTAKYAYTKSYLRKNPHVIPFFVKNKLQNYVSYLPNSEMAGILITSILPLLACLLILKNQNSKQLLREMFSYGNNPPITKEQTYISLFLLSIYWIIAIVTVIFFTSGHTESSEWQVYIASSILVFTQIAFIAYFQRYLTSKIYKLLVLLGCFLIFLLTVYLSFVLNLLNYNYLILLTSYLAFLIFQAKKNSKSFLGILLIQLLFVIAVTSYFFLDMNDIPLLALFYSHLFSLEFINYCQLRSRLRIHLSQSYYYS